MATTGWDRSLGTSKKEQGIITPPPPRRKKCGCWYRGRELWEMCQIHQDGLNNILKNMQMVAQQQKAMQDQKKQEEEKKDSPAAALEEEIKKEAPYSGFVENTDVTESTRVELT